MSKYLLSLVLVTILLSITSCDDDICLKGEGAIVTKTLTINDFNGVISKGSHDVIISEGPTQEVIAVGNSNIIDKIDTKVSNGIWEIDFDVKCLKQYSLTINITVPAIKYAHLSGSGNILINDFSSINDLDLIIDGSGNIELNALNGVENISSRISGSGNIICSTNATAINEDITIEGSGNYYGFPITANNASVKITGSGVCELSVEDKLNVTIEGSGNVRYKGTPVVTSSITGSGSVVKVN